MATGAPLDKRVLDFLLEFGVAAQKYAIYPAGHPQLSASVDRVMKRLDVVMVANRGITIGIARTQILVENAATDPANPVMKELAQRFHRHRVGAITINPEILRDELADFLLASSVEEHEGPQIALAAQNDRWPHIALTSLTYDKLELMGEDGQPLDVDARRKGAKQIWISLARATLMRADGQESEELLDPRVLARALNEHRNDPAYDSRRSSAR